MPSRAVLRVGAARAGIEPDLAVDGFDERALELADVHWAVLLWGLEIYEARHGAPATRPPKT
jgi:hypothetical protein